MCDNIDNDIALYYIVDVMLRYGMKMQKNVNRRKIVN